MSIQWTLIAGFLYAEIVFVLLLVLPIFSPQKWTRFFNSKFMQTLEKQAAWYFGLILFILVLFLLDAIREMRKYSDTEQIDHIHSHLDAEMQVNMRLFRAQRNFYISGFSLFLSLVIRRLIILINAQASLVAKCEAAIKQAKSATTAAKDYLAQKSDGEKEQSGSKQDENKKIAELKQKISSLEEELKKANKDKEAIKSQADSVSKEYDRLLKEHQKLQEVGKSGGDKKHE